MPIDIMKSPFIDDFPKVSSIVSPCVGTAQAAGWVLRPTSWRILVQRTASACGWTIRASCRPPGMLDESNRNRLGYNWYKYV